MSFLEEMLNSAKIDTFIKGCSGSSIEPSSKFSAGEGEGTRNTEGPGAILDDKLACKTNGFFVHSYPTIAHSPILDAFWEQKILYKFITELKLVQIAKNYFKSYHY